MQGAGDEFFAGAALAFDQHRRLRVGQPANHLLKRQHLWVVPNDLFGGFAFVEKDAATTLEGDRQQARLRQTMNRLSAITCGGM